MLSAQTGNILFLHCNNVRTDEHQKVKCCSVANSCNVIVSFSLFFGSYNAKSEKLDFYSGKLKKTNYYRNMLESRY